MTALMYPKTIRIAGDYRLARRFDRRFDGRREGIFPRVLCAE